MIKRTRVPLVTGLILFIMGISCNFSGNVAPTLVPPVPAATGDQVIYPDLSTLVYNSGGPVTSGDGSQQDVPPFWMGRSGVTNSQFQLCVATGACTAPDPKDNPGADDPGMGGLPVDGVDFGQAQAYCGWIGGSLPSEAQFLLMYKSVQLPPGPCDGNSSCSAGFGLTPEFVTDAAGTDAGGEESVIILQRGAIILQNNGIILQRGAIILQNNGIILQNGTANGIILQNTTGSTGQPLMHVFSARQKLHAPGLNFRCVLPTPSAIAPMCTFIRTPESGPGADFPPMVCKDPQPSITISSQFCTNGKPYFIVDIHNAESYEVGSVKNGGTPQVEVTDQTQNCTVDTADSTKDKTRLVCAGEPGADMTVYASSQCSPPAGWSPDKPCFNGYELDPKTNLCVYKGPAKSGLTCMQGFTLSPQGCCAPAKDYPAVCPAGSIASGSDCVAYSDIWRTVHKDVKLVQCSAPKGGGSCNLVCDVSCEPNPGCTGCQGIGGGSCKP